MKDLGNTRVKVDDSCKHPNVPNILGIAMFPHCTMERPQTCDNPESCHRLEEGEGTKDQIFQKHDPPTGHVSFFKGNGFLQSTVLEGYI